MNIAIDAMGGDNAPRAVAEGVSLVIGALPKDARITLYGDKESVSDALTSLGVRDERIQVVHTSQVVEMDESPTLAIRKKKDSSLVRAITAVADGEADCVLSAGSTGALLTGATLIIRRQPGVKRPALATILPTLNGSVLLLDCGANTDCKSEYLEQFAIMGAAYYKRVIGAENPRVGLLSNGAEEEKGNELTKAAHALLKQAPVNFVGNCEARDVLGGGFDVVVCDGFDGNVLLKGTEGAASLMMGLLKSGLTASFTAKLGALLCKPALRALKHKLDYTEIGGAPLLGVSGGVIKAHGSSNGKAFRSAIMQAVRLVSSGLVECVGADIAALAGAESSARAAEKAETD